MRVLLAIDNSPHSQAAVDAVVRRAWPEGSTVKILHVVEPVYQIAAEMWIGAIPNIDDIRQAELQAAQTLLDAAAEKLQGRHLEVTTVIAEGDARSAIVDEAGKWDADLIVIGSHGRSGLSRLLLGSVSSAVASHAHCSVEIVRMKPLNH